MNKHVDSTKQMIEYSMEKLNLSSTQLAALLGVSERSLNEWKTLQMGDLTPKAKRLLRLFEVLSYLETHFDSSKNLNYMKVLFDGLIILDPNDDEFGHTTLLTFITSDPENKAWVANVNMAMESFEPDEVLTLGHKKDVSRYISRS